MNHIEEIFDKDKIARSTNIYGNLDYMKLYDSLDSTDRATFERMYERFNQNREKYLETISVNYEETLPTKEFKNPVHKAKSSELVWKWRFVSEEYFTELLQKTNRQKKLSGLEDTLTKYKSVFQKIKPKALAKILSQEMFYFVLKMHNKIDDHSYYVSQLSLRLGQKVEEAFSQVIMTEYYRSTKDWQNTRKLTLTNRYRSKYWLHSSEPKWSAFDIATVGSSLLAVALKLFTVPTPNRFKPGFEPKPAFWHSMKLEKTRNIGIIRVSEALLKIISREGVAEALKDTGVNQSFPLLVKPRPWTAYNEGGYLYSSNTLLTSESMANEQTAYVKEAIAKGKMDKFLDSLDDVSSCAWGINQKMLQVIDEIWSTGKMFLDIPAQPEEMESVPDVSGKLTYEQKQKLIQQRVRLSNKRAERNNLGNALETAKLFAKRGDRFYYTYQVDFRGRVYPVSSSMFVHLGQDSIRSLLQFWYSKPLGKEGLRWLKIHLANMYGVDKLSNQDREDFVNTHMEDVIDSAERPLTGNRWWTQGENPFQALATCMEINEAIKSGNPELFLSRIAVNQDGSCNGLQHYAALGGDVGGAVQVNMIANATKPGDVYSEVAKIVSAKIEQEAVESKPVAEELKGKISRKLVKQPVMTSVYGVTKYGMVRQLDERFKDMGVDAIRRSRYSPYVAQLILEAIGELFSGANKIKEWLSECTQRISESVRADVYRRDIVSDKEFMTKHVTAMIWTTPLGLPVVQPYRQTQQMVVRSTQLQSMNLYNPFALSFVDKSRQRQGIAPNYIHSLDSTHMLMTVRECVKKGLSFAAVHDSFWTHAASVPSMNAILREQFVALHQHDLIEHLRNEFMARYSGYMQLVHVPISYKSYKEIQKLRGTNKEITSLRHELNLELKRFKGDKSIISPSTILENNGELRNYTRVGGQAGAFALDNTSTSKKTSLRVFVPLQIPHVPSQGDYDVAQVRQNEYFFS
ncbi:Rpo41p [Sugiyamaella lignohabitans]|uniref:DNA-directed RNA polymerase, mitochondrial n=1 Tax=Sugiyamaella lignohabitans TaxID=796027 RepID=A0A161HJK4_9ASCO|nr:Rpo41p [Sugiyamaella lignohabitans]ANB11608.1 Rpo41p [Sugiyamaella lignohabitans]